MPSAHTHNNMYPEEKRISGILASIYALRMLGMFLILPVFYLYASDLPGGDNKTWVGLAFGIYGLTQALFQLPMGMASDRFGRKKIIFLGLGIFALGSFLSAYADTVPLLIAARALQGAGAISAVTVALLADLTRDEVRTRAMAIIGLSIALTFSLSLVLGPILSYFVGVKGIFILTGILIILAGVVVYFFVPTPQKFRSHEDAELKLHHLPTVLKNKELWILNAGIFALHCAQMALFVTLPFILLDQFHLDKGSHWHIYLPVTLIGIFLMVPAIIVAEKKHKLKHALLFAIVLMAMAHLMISQSMTSLWLIILALCVYFTGLNILEAILPSWVSKVCSPYLKGTAMGVYNTFLSLGLFAGSILGSIILHTMNPKAVFYFCAILMLVWFILALLSNAPKPVSTKMYAIPFAWQNQIDDLHSNIQSLEGIEEISFSEDEETLYLKVINSHFDEAKLINKLSGETELCQ